MVRAENEKPEDPDVPFEQMAYMIEVVAILATTGHPCPSWERTQDVMRLCIKYQEAGCTVEEAAKKASEELRRIPDRSKKRGGCWPEKE